jgi:hypothetical protein
MKQRSSLDPKNAGPNGTSALLHPAMPNITLGQALGHDVYLKKSPRLITGHSPSIALYFAESNATSHSARV